MVCSGGTAVCLWAISVPQMRDSGSAVMSDVTGGTPVPLGLCKVYLRRDVGIRRFPCHWLRCLLLPAMLGTQAFAENIAESRGTESAQWEKTPVVELTARRSEMVLNDLWLFQPARGPSAEAPAGQWGWARVPGSWDRGSWDAGRYEGVVAMGAGGPWEGLKTETPSQSFPVLVLRGVDRAWYQREVNIPQDWAGRRVVLDLERVATDAKVFVNGQDCGAVNWPGGCVDVTAAIRPGTLNTIRLLVIAAGDGQEVLQYMDADIAIKTDTVLKHRGPIGDVVLSSEPAGGRVDGVFIMPSVRQKELAVDVELAGLKAGGAARLEAAALNVQTGETEKTWSMEVSLPTPDSEGQAVLRGVSLPWENPRLWDYKQPNLYNLRLTLVGEGIDDSIVQRFGFREFRIVGRQFFLNERPYNFRLHGLAESTVPAVAANHIEGLLAVNVNAAELWPTPDLVRGHDNTRARVARVADEKGLPLMAGVSEPTGVFDPAGAPASPEAFAQWEAMMKRSWKQLRNSPSVVVLLVAANRFSHVDDQNPRRIGNRKNLDFDETWQRTKAEPGNRVIAAVKALDPTRPVTSHHNANVGDFQTCNNYLNLLPLQEREDWLAMWAQDGDIPFSAVEFDAPFAATMNRGRKGWIGESTTEPWVTEFLAIYQGAKAYEEEDPAYRTMIAEKFVSGQDYKGIDIPSAKPFLSFTGWWMTRTLRAWRGYGLSGGIIHWSDAYGWKNNRDAESNHTFPAFEAGQRGAYVRRMLNREVFARLPEAANLTASGEALRDGYAPTLSWLAGPADAFTRQDHVFRSGESIVKSAALLNDTASPQPYSVEWSVEVGGAPAERGKASGEVAVGVPFFAPIEFVAPAVSAKTDGILRMKATIGDARMEDNFAFRVLPPPPPLAIKNPVFLLDPDGATAAWLQNLGVAAAPLPADAWPSNALVILGRNAMVTLTSLREGTLHKPRGTGVPPVTFDITAETAVPPEQNMVHARGAVGIKAPAAEWAALRMKIEAFVQSGGRLLIMSQDPDWIREMSGLRVARPVGRRFWPVPTQSAHPVLAGLDGEDFRDWRGAGTLTDPAPTTDLARPVPVVPRWGWHLNNTGSVASSAIEKPHFGRWTPLLEGEFDLAYSPLMEARLGNGVMVWCGLDLDGRTEPDPSAEMISRRLLTYLAGPLPPLPLQAPATYIGGAEGEKLLTSMGLAFTKATSMPLKPGLLIIGAGENAPSANVLEAFANSGGRVLLLGAAANTAGFTLAPKKIGGASLPPSWPEAVGLSSSDLRLRSETRTPALGPRPKRHRRQRPSRAESRRKRRHCRVSAQPGSSSRQRQNLFPIQPMAVHSCPLASAGQHGRNLPSRCRVPRFFSARVPTSAPGRRMENPGRVASSACTFVRPTRGRFRTRCHEDRRLGATRVR
jgi:beta-galactosidase